MAVKYNKKNGLFAAIGAATGLGNALRFPALCTVYGCSFLFAYVFCLAFICYPLLCAELRFGISGRSSGVWRAIMRAAAANSALIALYYFPFCVRLGCAFTDCAVGVSGALTPLVAVVAAVVIFLILRGRHAALSLSGKASVAAYLALFLPLAVCGILRGANPFTVFPVSLSSFARLSLWTDALGQSLMSLSLAAGVMPAFARTLKRGASVRRAAASIIAANLSGCILALLGTLSFAVQFPEGEGVTVAFSVFPQVVAAIAKTPLSARLSGSFIYAALTVVALHSACSLALPLLLSLFRRFKNLSAAVFTACSIALFPLFLWGGGEVADACDRMACTVLLVLISLAESLYLSFTDGRGFLLTLLCPAVCGLLFICSVCSARFNLFAPLARCFSYAACAAIILFAALPPAYERIKRRALLFDKPR